MRTAGDTAKPFRTDIVRRIAGAVVSGCLLALTFSTPSQASNDEFVVERTYFRIKIGDRPVRLEGLVIKRSDLTGRLPVALITHGKPANLTDMLDSRATDYAGQARDFARRGWLSVVVMRRGFGQSDGPIPAAMSCESSSFTNLFSADADDLQGALEVVSKRPDADPDRAIAIGVSAGGASVVALAARNPKNLRGVISISGGLRMTNCPKEDALVTSYKEFGLAGRVPSIWIYAKNDSYFGSALVERMQAAYLDGGGDVKLVMYDKFGNDGHALFSAATGRAQWLMEVDGFLRFLDLPTSKRDSINELMKLLKMDERNRDFLERYLAAPTHKVMAQTADGKSHATQYGASSMEIARTAVIESCREHFKAVEPCKIVMENDTWMAPVPQGQAARQTEQ